MTTVRSVDSGSVSNDKTRVSIFFLLWFFSAREIDIGTVDFYTTVTDLDLTWRLQSKLYWLHFLPHFQLIRIKFDLVIGTLS